MQKQLRGVRGPLGSILPTLTTEGKLPSAPRRFRRRVCKLSRERPASHCFPSHLPFRRQFPPSPSAPKIPSWQIPVKPSSPSNPVANNHNTSSDISPVSNESSSSSPVKENHSPEGPKVSCHLLGPEEEAEEPVVDVKGQVRMEVQGEEEKREDHGNEEEEEDEEEEKEDILQKYKKIT